MGKGRPSEDNTITAGYQRGQTLLIQMFITLVICSTVHLLY